MPWVAWKQVLLRSWREAGEDNIGLVAAGVAFYGFLALVPMMGAMLLSYGLIVDPATVLRHMQAVTELLPPDISGSMTDQLLQVAKTADGKKGLGLIAALGLALFGARNGAGGIIAALNIAYEENEKRGFVRLNLTALAITAAAVAAAIVATLAIAAIAAVGTFMSSANGAVLIAGTIATYTLLTLAGAAGAAALYRFAPSRSAARWTWISPGSLLAALLWLALTLGFSTYVANVGKFNATYGSLGAVVALLTWLYLSSYVLLFGAELNAELEHQTEIDTTTGATRPMGTRRAWVADHVVGDPVADPPTPLARPAAPATVDPQRASRLPDIARVRAGAQAARLAGLPKTGWTTSLLASTGLALLRRRGRRMAGAALLGAAAGIALLRSRD